MDSDASDDGNNHFDNDTGIDGKNNIESTGNNGNSDLRSIGIDRNYDFDKDTGNDGNYIFDNYNINDDTGNDGAYKINDDYDDDGYKAGIHGISNSLPLFCEGESESLPPFVSIPIQDCNFTQYHSLKFCEGDSNIPDHFHSEKAIISRQQSKATRISQ